MKKKTKKKLLKATKWTIKGIILLAIVYPAKGIWYLSKKAYQKRKQSKDKNEIKPKTVKAKQGKITSKPQYDALKELKKKKGTLKAFENQLLSNKSTIGIILGARGTGKSAIGMRLLENFKHKTSKNIYALGFKASSLPKWINCITDINQIQNNSVVLIDEGGIEFSSRQAMSNPNKLLSELLLIARHKDLSVMFITQNCLPTNTKVNTPEGVKTLEQLKKEDVVLSYDFKNEKIVPAIAKKFNVNKKKLVKIHLEDGTVLKCSPNHRWPVYGENGLTHKTTQNLKIDKDCLIHVSKEM